LIIADIEIKKLGGVGSAGDVIVEPTKEGIAAGGLGCVIVERAEIEKRYLDDKTKLIATGFDPLKIGGLLGSVGELRVEPTKEGVSLIDKRVVLDLEEPLKRLIKRDISTDRRVVLDLEEPLKRLIKKDKKDKKDKKKKRKEGSSLSKELGKSNGESIIGYNKGNSVISKRLANVDKAHHIEAGNNPMFLKHCRHPKTLGQISEINRHRCR
jgi:hypothetical protein